MTRTAEILGMRKEKTPAGTAWFTDQAGIVRPRQVPVPEVADVGTDLGLIQALQRRGIALDIAGSMSFESHQGLVDRLMQKYQRPSLFLAHASVSVVQPERADRHVWQRMAELACGSLRRRPD